MGDIQGFSSLPPRDITPFFSEVAVAVIDRRNPVFEHGFESGGLTRRSTSTPWSFRPVSTDRCLPSMMVITPCVHCV